MKAKGWLKNNWLNVALTLFIMLMLLYTPAKVWMLQRLMDTGLFNASVNDAKLHAQPMTFKNADGELISTQNLQGRLVFINFWATWCPPCLAEMPSIQNLYDRYKDDKRIIFIMADADNKIIESTNFLLKRKIDIPVYATYSSIDPSLYTGTLPTTIILNKKGEVILNHRGIGRYDTRTIYELLDRELKD